MKFLASVFIPIAILILIAPIAFAAPTLVSTVPANQITNQSAVLNGNLDAMGSGPPTLTQGPTVLNNGAASFSQAFTINSTDNFLLAQVARGFNCGTISAFTMGGNSLTMIPNSMAWTVPTSSGGITGLNWTGVEQWYISNPPVGGSVTLSVTWTSACDANSAHFIGVLIFSGVVGTPTATGVQTNNATSVSGTITFTFSGPNSTQWESTVISDGWDAVNGVQNATLSNPIGYSYPWSGCRSGLEHCAAGGIGANGIVKWQAAGSVFYSASGVVISGSNPTMIDCFFQYGVTTNLEFDSLHRNLSSPGAFNQSITSLQPNTLYYFRAMANNGSGLANGSTLTFQTKGYAQSEIQSAVFDAPWIVVFVSLITLGMIGAWNIKKKRGG